MNSERWFEAGDSERQIRSIADHAQQLFMQSRCAALNNRPNDLEKTAGIAYLFFLDRCRLHDC